MNRNIYRLLKILHLIGLSLLAVLATALGVVKPKWGKDRRCR